KASAPCFRRSEMARRIGFIGLGNMGAPMARRLAAGGHRLVACDAQDAARQRFAAQGHAIAGSPRELADQCEIVFASLPTPEVLREVALGARGVVEGQAVRLFVDMSTTGPKVAI